MNNKPILFYDSGIGGLPYLSWIKDLEPDESLVYFADTANFPYGEKDVEQLQKIIIDAMGRLICRTDPKLVVLACNTASVVALKKLRETFDIPFVGTVPAIKPAADKPGAGALDGKRDEVKRLRIGLLATNRTVEDRYTDKLIEDYASHCEIIRFGSAGLVDFIEKQFLRASDDEKKKILRPITDFFRCERIDVLVLGCTHFIFLKDEFKALLGEDVMIVDSVEGVGRQILRTVEKIGRRDPVSLKNSFYLTSNGKEPGKDIISAFASGCGLIDGGIV